MNTPDMEYINSLVERETHCDTMKPLTPLERQHLEDWRVHFEATYASVAKEAERSERD